MLKLGVRESQIASASPTSWQAEFCCRSWAGGGVVDVGSGKVRVRGLSVGCMVMGCGWKLRALAWMMFVVAIDRWARWKSRSCEESIISYAELI